MKVRDLKHQILNLPPDLEVFIRAKVNPCRNIIEAGRAKKSTYSFFRHSIDCVIIEPQSDDDE